MMTRRIVYATCVLMAGSAAPALADDLQDLLKLKSTAAVRDAWSDRYQESRRGPELTERFSRTARLGRNGTLDLSNISGDIDIRGGNGDQVRIEATKRVRHRDESEAKSTLEAVQIDVVESPNRVEVRTEYPRRTRNVSVSVDFTVTMPENASATVRTVSGDLRVASVNGEVRLESVSGDVVATGVRRLVQAKSVSGDIDVSDVSAESEVTLSTVSGDLTVRTVKARALDVGTVSGDARLSSVETSRANIRSVSGGIEYTGALQRNGRYEMNSHSGDVRLSVTSDTGFDLDATTFSGNVRSDIPLTLRTGQENDRRGRARSIRGSYGDASAILSLKTFSGDIVIARR